MIAGSVTGSPYGWLMLAAIGVSIVFWTRLARRDDRLLLVYVAALIGAFAGAKVVYVLAEGWRDFGRPDQWQRLATGKSVLGALLGGYLSVELAKRWLGYAGITGDWFALIVPWGISLGRVGCWFHGCCLGRVWEPAWFTLRDASGVARWPAVPLEMFFNVMMGVMFLILRRQGRWAGQHFHIYLMAYGVFRFAHEFFRDTPRVTGILSGYQLAAVAVVLLGALRFRQRAQRVDVPA